MWILLLLAATFAAAPASGGELCFQYGWFNCCDTSGLCDNPALAPWRGFRTDSVACADSTPSWYDGVFSLSASATDPYVNGGPIPSDGRLYLWNVLSGLAYAGPGYGYGWGYFYLTVVGDLPIQAYEPIASGAPNGWDQSTGELYFSTCGTDLPAPTLVGAFVIGTSAVEGRTWGSMKALYR